ncbi:MAG: sulfatase [Acidobacteriia bacterium]|nr:sulfatase [Terriglobia bacterium]MYG04484.1 sulfatase [Terriglobia bacterium]MYK12095.1 sulfatase [Terriglobia bacterium]
MLNRRQFLATSLAGSLACSRTEAQRPNVLFLIVDDMNDYGFYNTLGGVKTPHLDRFKSTALTFEKAYCASPACVPSRAAVFSGLYPHTTGAYRNGSDPWTQAPLDSTESLPELFQRSGYTSYGQGKLTHAPVADEKLRAMWDNKPHGGGFGPFPPEEDQVAGRFWGWTPWEEPDSDFPDVVNGDSVVDFLSQEHERPFFLAYGLWRPHTPFTAPKRFFEMYDLADVELPPYKEDDLADVPQLGRDLAAVWGERFVVSGKDTEQSWREFVWAYLACTSFADWSCGRVLDALDNSPYADNTIVVFWSDNGYHCGEKDHWEKTTLWEQASLTPMAIRLPGSAHAGKTCARPVGSIDLYPTLADYCRLEPTAHQLEGRSLRPLLEDPQADWASPALTTFGEGYASVRDERFRYIRYPDGTEELYDHESDPHEWTNLAADPAHTTVKQRLGAAIPEQFAKSLGGRMG